MHFVFLSQILGTVPLAMPKAHWKSVRSYSGLRVVYLGKYVHPKLHLFVIGGTGSAKGAGQKALEFLFTTFNISEFAKRYNVSPPYSDNIWQALESHTAELRKAAWEHKVVRKTIGVDKKIEDLSQDKNVLDDIQNVAERKEELKAIMGEKPKDADKVEVLPYKMSEHEKREIKEAFRLKSGDRWTQFGSKNFFTWPVFLKKNTSTSADLVGGYDQDKTKEDSKNSKLVWIPGYFQTHALLGYDEARSIMSNSDSEMYGLMCGALDDSGEVETKARKDRDEYGNVISYQTCTSMVAGTTDFADLSTYVAMGGFLQRFIIHYRHPSLAEKIRTQKDIVMNKNDPDTQWNLAQAYYKAVASINFPANNVIKASDEGRAKILELLDRDYAYFGKTLGYGNHTFNMATGFMNRRAGFYFKAAALVAAVEGTPTFSAEQCETMYKLIAEPWNMSIAEYLENCFSSSEIAEAERKEMVLN